jgi:hypothetical protein
MLFRQKKLTMMVSALLDRNLFLISCSLFANYHLYDYTAPTEKAMSVGNIVKSPTTKIMGIEMPSFLTDFFAKESASDYLPVGHIIDEMDEECYLGKNGDSDDCVDFDP